jgi:hypothetical protein
MRDHLLSVCEAAHRAAPEVALRPEWLWRCTLSFCPDALVLRDDLSTEQQQGRGDLEAQKHDDGLDVVSDPWTTLTVAVIPPISACRHDGRPTAGPGRSYAVCCPKVRISQYQAEQTARGRRTKKRPGGKATPAAIADPSRCPQQRAAREPCFDLTTCRIAPSRC